MKPELVTAIAQIRRHVAVVRRSGGTIGFVPTMGALHAGHGALMDCARTGSDHVVVSIFVNPIQFNHRGDYEAYPNDLVPDLDFCKSRGVDVVFAPSAEDMYSSPQRTFVEVTGISDHLCGQFRPGHFRGVATVVTKLFNIVSPDKAYFGDKDAQQLAVIQKMVNDLNMPVEIVPVETVREPDGLALSSRNKRLTPEERRIAPALFRALQLTQNLIANGSESTPEIRQAALLQLQEEPGIRVEYFEVVDPTTMAPIEQVSGPVRIAAAVWLGTTRLIDNVYFIPPVRR